MKKLTLAIGLSITAMTATAVAYAAQGTPEIARGMKADANGDGTVTRAEMQAQTAERFAKMDTNKDGKVDQTDRDAMRAERHARHFAMLDKDSNGQISKAEFDAAHAGQGLRGAMGGGDGDKRGHWRHGRGGHGGGHGGMMMRTADANSDGAITKAEMDAAAAMHFDMVDADKDGSVTAAERKAAHEKMREQWRSQRGKATSGS